MPSTPMIKIFGFLDVVIKPFDKKYYSKMKNKIVNPAIYHCTKICCKKLVKTTSLKKRRMNFQF